MRRPRSNLFVAAAGIAAILAAACSARDPGAKGPGGEAVLAIRDVWLWDATRPTGAAGRTVVIRGDRIVEVGPSERVAVPDGATVIEGAGLHLIPGLWDMHVHALWADGVPETFLPLFVAHGVTGVRDMGGEIEILLRVREDLRTGRLLGPRLVAAGPILDGPEPVDPRASWALATPADARAAVDSLAEIDVDFLKVYTLLPPPVFDAVVEAAAERSLPVAGHVPAEVGPIEAARAGMITIEHMMSELDYFCDPDDPAACEPNFEAFRAHGTRQVPALVEEREPSKEAAAADPRLRFLPPPVLALWFGGEVEPDPGPRTAAPPAPAEPREALELARALHRAGISLLAGTDAGIPFTFPGSSLHEELDLLVAAGLTPAEALAAATSGPAELLGRDDLGTIAPGKRADLVLLRGNPLEDVRHTREIEAVILDGALLDRERLDRILQEVEAKARASRASDRESG